MILKKVIDANSGMKWAVNARSGYDDAGYCWLEKIKSTGRCHHTLSDVEKEKWSVISDEVSSSLWAKLDGRGWPGLKDVFWCFKTTFQNVAPNFELTKKQRESYVERIYQCMFDSGRIFFDGTGMVLMLLPVFGTYVFWITGGGLNLVLQFLVNFSYCFVIMVFSSTASGQLNGLLAWTFY